MNATLHFHSFADKAAFIARNGISPSEIISQTLGTLTIANGADFVYSPFVYQVTF